MFRCIWVYFWIIATAALHNHFLSATMKIIYISEISLFQPSMEIGLPSSFYRKERNMYRYIAYEKVLLNIVAKCKYAAIILLCCRKFQGKVYLCWEWKRIQHSLFPNKETCLLKIIFNFVTFYLTCNIKFQ